VEESVFIMPNEIPLAIPNVPPDPSDVQRAERADDAEGAAPPAAARRDAGEGVATVERVLAVFEVFHRVQRPLSLTELARLADIPKSSCHAIVKTLAARGHLYQLQRPRALYPTRRLYDLTREIHANDPLVERVVPLLERLRNTSQETVILGKQQGEAVIYLQVLESPNPIRYSARPGEFKPLHASAIGKALLGGLKDAALATSLAALPLPRVTPRTLTDPHRLAQDIAEGRRRGYYVTRGENVPDVWAVSTALALDGQTLAVAIAGPRHRMEARVVECAQLLLATCGLITRQWGSG
jgi:DNA-binding IclR family transcriptional regulator